VRAWFQALGELEAICALAQLAHDNPSWVFAVVDHHAQQFTAEGLGHPLLADTVRVTNDVEVGPAGTFLLVTGSNMSGKSTLLRAIGLNAILAEAGAPVCATRLSLPPVVLQTSMRIRDSLAEGVSFFMAELKRLKAIVDCAEELRSKSARRLLYLLDEILLGTNSRDRHLAVVCVLRHLLDCGAIGAVSTHDIGLAHAEELRDACRAVHFSETLHGSGAERPMTFDFQLRPGIATSTNAMKLVEMVGLGKGG
jgi:DNA mismatch repair ATPase MutS